ncbi:MAG: hypothetical protein IIA87_01635 [Nanoarchaeota archaeon]|nr:hypothetical protein [Nanoarchaeota archaeon]
MAVSIHNLIAAINPDVYCAPEVKAEVKKLVKTQGFLKAAEKAKPFKSDIVFDYDEAYKEPFAKWGLKAPSEEHEIIYDSTTEGLEPLYFWILDFLNNSSKEVEKITDNFISSPGSGHFSELTGKATRMQEEAMKMLGTVNTVIKSILNIVYDLKEFKLRLGNYEDLKSKIPEKKSSAMLSLKQIWMDQVDFPKRGTTSLKNLAAQFDYVTIIDAFMIANSLADVKKLDLNDRVKRILEQRVGEFLKWIEESEQELNKRFKIEKNYLKSQVNTVKLYSRWIKPYLKSARKLEQSTTSMQSALVTAFNTIILELTLLAKDEYKLEEDIEKGILPKSFEKIKKRKYMPFVVVELKFRGIPHRAGQHYTFGGRTEIKFTSYALNDQELKVLKEEMEKDDFGEVMKLIEGATTESLEQIEKDIEEILEDKKTEDKKEKKKTGDVNPFTALFSFLKTEKEKHPEEELPKVIKPDNEYEKIIRSQAIIAARDKCFLVFDIYKKAHAMPSYTTPFEPYS